MKTDEHEDMDAELRSLMRQLRDLTFLLIQAMNRLQKQRDEAQKKTYLT